MSDRLDVFVICAPGLEPLVAAEIEKLGVRGPRPRHGGVDASVTLAQLWSLNLRLRTATRVLVRVGRIPADTFATLQAGLRRIDWPQWLAPGTVVQLKVASSGSALFHTGAVAERAAEVLAAAGFVVDAPGSDDEAASGTTQVLHLRLVDDVVLVSLDASGAPLYRRGWRLATAKAPLRETLAAALLHHAGWNRKAPVVDPVCGSGTIVIEAALMARRMAAGRARSFAFEAWPSFDPVGWARLLAGADADVVPGPSVFLGADRDAGAIAAARANAERAGVADLIEFREAPVSELRLPARPGWIVSNPPYGKRIGGAPVTGAPPDLRDLYDRFGAVLHERAVGWGVELVVGETPPAPDGRPTRPLVDRLRLTVEDRIRTTNGGLAVDLVRARVPAPG